MGARLGYLGNVIDDYRRAPKARLSTERQASRGFRVADALLHSNRCFCGARVPITTGPREWHLDWAEIARLL
jgi:hypothetical protein